MRGWFGQHGNAMRSALRRLFASPLNTLLSLLVMGIALAMPSAAWVVLDNLRALAGNAAGVQQISIFMRTDASESDVAEIKTRLVEAKAGSWSFVARAEALKRMQETDGMAEIVASLPKNPLPDAFVVEPADARPEALQTLATSFASWPKVAHVQLDSAWVKRFDTFLRIGKLATSLLAGLLASALVAVTFNTIRLQILAQGAEIEVAKLIGATDAFICLPFQYFGALQGALGGLFAAALVFAGGRMLESPVGELIELYGSAEQFVLHGLTLQGVAVLAGLGAALGWLGAQLSVAIHLRRLD